MRIKLTAATHARTHALRNGKEERKLALERERERERVNSGAARLHCGPAREERKWVTESRERE